MRRVQHVSRSRCGSHPWPSSWWHWPRAGPPPGRWTWSVPLEPGKERFHKLCVVDWVEVEDPSIATAEVLPGSNELLLTGHKPGRTLLLLYARGVRGVAARRGGRPSRARAHRGAAGRRAQGVSGLKTTEGADAR